MATDAPGVGPLANWRYVLAGVFVGLAVGVAYFFGFPRLEAPSRNGELSPSGLTPGPAEGSLAPDFALQDLQGNTIQLSQLRGQVVLINFWATWCGPCRLEMPVIQDRFERYKDQGFTVLAVNFDEPEDLVKAFGEELSLTFPLLLDPGGEVQQLYRVRGYPTTVMVDRDGMIRAVHIGVMTEGQVDGYLDRLLIGG